MSITPETVAHVAKLARLELSAEELDRYSRDLTGILGLVKELDALNLDEVSLETTAAEPPACIESWAPMHFVVAFPAGDSGLDEQARYVLGELVATASSRVSMPRIRVEGHAEPCGVEEGDSGEYLTSADKARWDRWHETASVGGA